MLSFLLKRFGQSLITLLFVSFMAYSLTFLVGSPVDALLPSDATAADAERLTRDLGLDKPLYVQYGKFLQRAVRGDFGESIKWRGESAMGMVFQRLPATLRLSGIALLGSLMISIPVGVLAAVKKNSWFDKFAKMIALLGQALPPFWLGIILIWIFGVLLGWLPAGGDGTFKHIILPAIALGWYQVAAILRLTRSAMLDSMDSEYIKLGRMKGVSESRIIWIHALRNACIVPLTYLGLLIGTIITRTVVVETVFGWPGTGTLVMQAVLGRDFPVITAMIVTFSAIFIAVSLIMDVLYAIIDPRIRI
ncbi:MAG: ABC transporter permease [Sphaerochaetaceae bacterium]|nr:ABC transporter permease [Sphaerochaetaceae bacterium]